jgi:hypothetical protein
VAQARDISNLTIMRTTAPSVERRPPRMTPMPDRELVNRPELVDRLVGLLQSPPGPAIALCGTGGFGKTTLATQVCRRPDVESAFPGGTFGSRWVQSCPIPC